MTLHTQLGDASLISDINFSTLSRPVRLSVHSEPVGDQAGWTVVATSEGTNRAQSQTFTHTTDGTLVHQEVQSSTVAAESVKQIFSEKSQHEIDFHPDDSRVLTVSLDAPRMKLVHPTCTEIGQGWALAWLRIDTGRVSLEVTTITYEQWANPRFTQPERRRVAEVWTALDAIALSVAAPTITAHGEGFLVAWREQRGPVPSVYLQALDGVGRIAEKELRVSTRGVAADAVRPALASNKRNEWACAFGETVGGVERVRLATAMQSAS